MMIRRIIYVFIAVAVIISIGFVLSNIGSRDKGLEEAGEQSQKIEAGIDTLGASVEESKEIDVRIENTLGDIGKTNTVIREGIDQSQEIAGEIGESIGRIKNLIKKSESIFEKYRDQI